MEEKMGLIPERLSRSVERYGLGHIRPRHEEIARRLVMGQSQSDIARHLGINIGRLSIIVNSPLFKIVLARLSKLRDESVTDLQEELKELAPIALNEVAKVAMTSTSERLRLSASESLLDRAGLIKKGQGINLGIKVDINPVDLDKYKYESTTIEASVGSDGGDVHSMNDGKNMDVIPDNGNGNGNSEGDLKEDLKLLEETLTAPVGVPVEPVVEDKTSLLETIRKQLKEEEENK
jgi:hypothetical protein